MSDPATPPVEEAPRRACTRHHPTPDSACGWCDTATNEYRRATRNYAAARPVSGDTEGLREAILSDEADAHDPERPVPPEIKTAWIAGVDAALERVQPLLDQKDRERAIETLMHRWGVADDDQDAYDGAAADWDALYAAVVQPLLDQKDRDADAVAQDVARRITKRLREVEAERDALREKVAVVEREASALRALAASLWCRRHHPTHSVTCDEARAEVRAALASPTPGSAEPAEPDREVLAVPSPEALADQVRLAVPAIFPGIAERIADALHGYLTAPAAPEGEQEDEQR